jgi:hypothetical protein
MVDEHTWAVIRKMMERLAHWDGFSEALGTGAQRTKLEQ